MRYILVFQDPRYRGDTASDPASPSYLVVDTTPTAGAPAVIAACADGTVGQSIVDALNA